MVPYSSQGDGGVSYTLNKLHNRSSNPDRALLQAFRKVGGLCETLNLPGVVKDSACEIYKNVTTAKLLKGRQTQVRALSTSTPVSADLVKSRPELTGDGVQVEAITCRHVYECMYQSKHDSNNVSSKCARMNVL